MDPASEPTAETALPENWNALSLSRPFLLEVFVLANLFFLILDVYLAHSFNDFAHWAEWIPVYFSIGGTIVLAFAIWEEYNRRSDRSRWLGLVVGWAAIAVGLAGLVWHLEGWFFASVTLKSLVYSAPFVAPLSFAGLGCLLLLNRMEDPQSVVWGQWIVFLAWGGFVGNFGLSLIDHAQNAFFYWTEWIPVIVSALAVGHLAAVLLKRPTRPMLLVGYGILLLQAVTGILGFGLHLSPLCSEGALGGSLWDALRYGAPVFAPLLFGDIAALAALGLWDLDEKLSTNP